MKIITGKYGRWMLTLLFGVAVFLFWRQLYPFALTYQEQYQLFLFNSDYLVERIALPGGVARYVAEFLVQMFNNVTFGAAILSFVFMSAQLAVWRLIVKHAGEKAVGAWYAVSFVPVLALWYVMGDENVMPTFAVAWLMVLVVMLLCPRAVKLQLVYLLLATPILYWLAGSVALVVPFYALLWAMTLPDSRMQRLFFAMLALLEGLLCVLFSSWLVPYSVTQLFEGIGYYRFFMVSPWMLFLVALLSAIAPFAARLLPAVSQPGRVAAALLASVLVVAAIVGWAVPRGYDAKSYELIEYDYLVRTQDWNGIVAKAERQMPDLPMSVCATNLALAMKGQLGDRLFHFYQNGTEGLLPEFSRNFTPLLVTAEAYWQLGLVNTAQRFDFEAMEALPNYNKSGRIVKRLVETNLVNGQYAVARKYLDLLDQTMFYRKWAQRTRQLIDHPEAIDSHPLYGRLRKARLQEDFLFSEDEVDKALGRLLMHNPDNTMAMQYLLAYPLLNRDVNLFMNYMMFVDKLHKYNPQSCQEAIAYAYMKQGQQPPAEYVSPVVMRRFSDFAQLMQRGAMQSPQMEAFRNTCWYYLVKGAK